VEQRHLDLLAHRKIHNNPKATLPPLLDDEGVKIQEKIYENWSGKKLERKYLKNEIGKLFTEYRRQNKIVQSSSSQNNILPESASVSTLDENGSGNIKKSKLNSSGTMTIEAKEPN